MLAHNILARERLYHIISVKFSTDWNLSLFHLGIVCLWGSLQLCKFWKSRIMAQIQYSHDY